MLEDMIKVGPPKRAQETYYQKEKEYYERNKKGITWLDLASEKSQNLQFEKPLMQQQIPSQEEDQIEEKLKSVSIP